MTYAASNATSGGHNPWIGTQLIFSRDRQTLSAFCYKYIFLDIERSSSNKLNRTHGLKARKRDIDSYVL